MGLYHPASSIEALSWLHAGLYGHQLCAREPSLAGGQIYTTSSTGLEAGSACA